MTPEEFEHVAKMIMIYSNILKTMYNKDNVVQNDFYHAIEALEDTTGLSLTEYI